MNRPATVLVVDDHDDADSYVRHGQSHYRVVDVTYDENTDIMVVTLDLHDVISVVSGFRKHRTPK